MDDIILISNINDFIFCPVSIYFHNLYGSENKLMFQSEYQLNGTKAHETVDSNRYSTRAEIIISLDVYSDVYRIVGKIDIYNGKQKKLIERKKHVTKIYDGYVFQLYAQYYCMLEMGYEVRKLEIHSIDDNRKYKIELPDDDLGMKEKFEKTLIGMRTFKMESFEQLNIEKCGKCIYEDACDRALNR
mgnify:FL=1